MKQTKSDFVIVYFEDWFIVNPIRYEFFVDRKGVAKVVLESEDKQVEFYTHHIENVKPVLDRYFSEKHGVYELADYNGWFCPSDWYEDNKNSKTNNETGNKESNETSTICLSAKEFEQLVKAGKSAYRLLWFADYTEEFVKESISRVRKKAHKAHIDTGKMDELCDEMLNAYAQFRSAAEQTERHLDEVWELAEAGERRNEE